MSMVSATSYRFQSPIPRVLINYDRSSGFPSGEA